MEEGGQWGVLSPLWGYGAGVGVAGGVGLEGCCFGAHAPPGGGVGGSGENGSGNTV